MYAIKGSWVGQTFALAKGNDYEGRKSRIRRSKEERKEMVESFIKNYQISSNGSFPSLNLTHKEVGGSFYTVREIVREIIQENRVLGPAKLTPEEQNSDLITEQYQLGSISSDLQIPILVPSSENDSVSNHLSLNDDLILNSNGQFTEQKILKLVNGQTVNGSEECERNNEGDELIGEQIQVIDTSEADKFIEEKLETSAPVSQAFDKVIVETFPVRPVSKPTNGFGGSSDDGKNVTFAEEAGHQKVSSAFSGRSTENCSSFMDEIETANAKGQLVNGQTVNGSEECERNNEGDESIGEQMQVIDTSEADKFIEEKLETSAPLSQVFDNVIVELFPVRPVSKPTNGFGGSSDDAKNVPLTEEAEHQKVSSTFSGRSTENCSSFMDEIEITNAEDPLVEIESSSRNEIVTVTLDDQVLKAPSFVNEGIKYDTAPNGKSTNVNETNSSRRKKLSYIEANAKETKLDVQPSSSTQKASKATLDRINLESWEGASKKHTDQETNPVFVILKAFVAAFVKFWSE